MKTLEQLLAIIAAGQPVILNGEHLTTAAQVEKAYPGAEKAFEDAQVSTPQALVAGLAELKAEPLKTFDGYATKADLDALHERLLNSTVPKTEYDALAAKLATDYVPLADANALAARNSVQANLIDALTTPEALGALPEAALNAVAKFAEIKPGKTMDETVKAILAKRSH